MIIRPAHLDDAPGIARVHVDAWRTTYRGIVPDEVLVNLSYERRERMWQDLLNRPPEARQIIFVAEVPEGGVVGFAAGGPESSGDPVYDGELYAIYLLEAWQGKGLGRWLFQALAAGLAAAGFSAFLLWVLAENHRARRFYESLGGRQVKERPLEIGGLALPEVAYGWANLSALMDRRNESFGLLPPPDD